ncbi:hypothetical protein ACUN8C_08360 [Kushneria sp. Sum13]|uniref:hypothetical protein n=1 Tax=Kushneria sp. Sum13 TaxID=3459196 RepID=UPI004045BBE0
MHAVAHKLSTISNFDRIVVMEQGRIIEDGSPGELRRQGGVFASMWRMQSDEFIAETLPTGS